MQPLKMHTPNKVENNIDAIAKLFPNTLTETIKGYNEDGSPIIEKAIDFDMLKQELSSVIVEGNEERYQFTWPDKKKSILLANSPIAKTLRPCKEESVDFDTTENLYIEGDNLDVLKMLQETYLNKVKMIYIDPPYNTGKDFVYSDKFNIDAEDYMQNSGQFDEEGNRLVQNTESNGRFHTDWLNMIYPRLKLAKDLLTDDGVIFISIDDNEVENLKKICNEIFGESNFVGEYIKQSKVGGGSDSKHIVKEHEYCMCFAKRIDFLPEMFTEHNADYLKRYNEQDEKGRYFWDTFARPGLQIKSEESLVYEIICPDNTVLKTRWIRSKERFKKEYTDGTIRIIKKSNGEWSVQFKQYLNSSGKKPRSMTMEFGGTIEGKNEIAQLFGNDKIFTYPKSTVYLKELFKTIAISSAIILDFFSGSATTAHAVMQLNAEDGGNRKFIMVQLPEETDEKSEAYKAGYKNICEIGKERIRRAGKKIKSKLLEEGQDIQNIAKQKEENPDQLLYVSDAHWENDPKYIDKNKELANKLDIGFRVLKADSTNMKDVFYNPAEYTQEMLDGITDNIKEDRTPEDLLFQVMLDLGVLLSSKIDEKVICGKKIFNVAENYLLACFDDNITEEVVTAIAKERPYYAVFRDSSIATDSVATNFEQIFNTYSPTTIRKVL